MSGPRFRLLMYFITFFLAGCGGGGGGGGDGPGGSTIDDVQTYFYSGRPGDTLTYSETLTLTAGGGSGSSTVTEVNTFDAAQSIPDKYRYAGSIPGPYLYLETRQDGVLGGQTYMTMAGDEIIDDGLDTFTNVDHVTWTGEPEPSTVTLGVPFEARSESILFSSETGEEAGSQTVILTMTCEAKTRLTVPAGTYEALRFHFSNSYQTIENGAISDMSITGMIWYGRGVGEIKTKATVSGTYEGVAVTGTLVRSLQSADLSAPRAAIGSSPQELPTRLAATLQKSLRAVVRRTRT